MPKGVYSPKTHEEQLKYHNYEDFKHSKPIPMKDTHKHIGLDV